MFAKGKGKLLVVSLLMCFMVVSLTACSQTQTADTWPGKKQVTMAICYTAGGSADIIARGLAREMQEYLKININCINVVGASGAIAGKQVFEAPPDGYAWLAGVAHTVSGWRTLKFADISWSDSYGFHAATSPYIFFVSAKSEWKNIEDIIQFMKSNPDKLKWGSAGMGSINHVTGVGMLNVVGAKAIHVPYNGGREAGIKLISGEIDFSWAGLSDVADLVKSGEIRVLGVVDPKDYNVTGKNQYVAPSMVKKWPQLSVMEDLLYWGINIRRDTPEAIVKKINEAFAYAVKQPRFIELCQSRELVVKPMTGIENDKLSARLESIYAWGLNDTGLAAKGVSPADFQIPKISEFKWPPNEKAAKMRPWPQ